MEVEELSVIIRFSPSLQSNAVLLHVVSVATGEAVLFRDASFLLRISIDAKASVTRCSIRHIVSDREAYMQGGPKLRAFVEDCLLNSDRSPSAAPDTPDE